MEMLYNSRGIYNFIDVDMGARQDIEGRGLMYKIKMLEKNEIPYLVTPYENEVDGKFYLRFNTDSNYVLERLMQKIKPDGKFLKLIVGQLIQCIGSSSQYLLNPNDIVVNPAYMFFNYTEKKLKLICVPGYEKNITLQIRNLLEYFMRIFDHRDSEGVRYLYELYECVTEEDFSIYEYGKINEEKLLVVSCEEKKDEALNSPLGSDVKQSGEVHGYTVPPAVSVSLENISDDAEDEESAGVDRNVILIIIIFSLSLVFGAKYVFGGRDPVWLFLCMAGMASSALFMISAIGTTKEEQEMDESMKVYRMQSFEQKNCEYKSEKIHEVRHEEKSEKRYEEPCKEKCVEYRLVPLNNGCLEPLNIKIEGEEVSIGRGKKENAYRLSGSQISRIHARVYKRNTALYLRDEGSTNGTFVNSVRLLKNAEVKLNRGDVVAFATEEFFVS